MLEEGTVTRAIRRKRIFIRTIENSRVKSRLLGSIEGGHYDGYYGDSGRIGPNDSYDKIPRKYEQKEAPSYTDTVLRSSVSQSITYHLGGPVTQPSTMIQLRRDATVYCRPNVTYYHKNSFTTCNVTECLFDLVNDPCETKNIAQQYPRVREEDARSRATALPPRRPSSAVVRRWKKIVRSRSPNLSEDRARFRDGTHYPRKTDHAVLK